MSRLLKLFLGAYVDKVFKKIEKENKISELIEPIRKNGISTKNLENLISVANK